jgi:hypothetical protein
VKLDPKILADLAVAVTPKAYLRVTPMAFASTPLGAGFGQTRFASPTRAFKAIYLARDLTTGVAETIVRDRFENRTRRRLLRSEVDLWGVTEVSATAPFTLIDLRTTGLVRLGVSTNAARAKSQTQGRKLSQAIYDQTTADGLIYLSRLTAGLCLCLYERALPGTLTATPVLPVARAARFLPALQALNVRLDAVP